MQLTFECIAENTPGPEWQHRFHALWPAYRNWFRQSDENTSNRETSGASAIRVPGALDESFRYRLEQHMGGPSRISTRPSLETSRRRLGEYMPELLPVFDQLLELSGGDETAGQFLSCYRPPRYLGGCSQAIWQRDGDSLLVRNYDLDPRLNDGLLMYSRWRGRGVIASSEFLWGVADGMNESGLALSLAFGGRKVVGNGFGIPLILRYILEVCDEVKEAIEVLQNIRSHMAYNVTLLDREGEHVTVQVSPDQTATVLREPQATNHQRKSRWPEHARFTRTFERERRLKRRLGDQTLDASGFIDGFLQPPLYSTGYEDGFGTLYTAVYNPAEGVVEWRWPGECWRQEFKNFQAGKHLVHYSKAGARVVDPSSSEYRDGVATVSSSRPGLRSASSFSDGTGRQNIPYA